MLDGQKRCEITAARAQPKSMKSCCENRMHRILIAAHFVMVFFQQQQLKIDIKWPFDSVLYFKSRACFHVPKTSRSMAVPTIPRISKDPP
jgi:hypothetical protein